MKYLRVFFGISLLLLAMGSVKGGPMKGESVTSERGERALSAESRRLTPAAPVGWNAVRETFERACVQQLLEKESASTEQAAAFEEFALFLEGALFC